MTEYLAPLWGFLSHKIEWFTAKDFYSIKLYIFRKHSFSITYVYTYVFDLKYQLICKMQILLSLVQPNVKTKSTTGRTYLPNKTRLTCETRFENSTKYTSTNQFTFFQVTISQQKDQLKEFNTILKPLCNTYWLSLVVEKNNTARRLTVCVTLSSCYFRCSLENRIFVNIWIVYFVIICFR